MNKPTTKTRKPKINEQGWEEVDRLPYGIRFFGGACGAHVVVLETVKLQRMIDGELHYRSEIQEADVIYPQDLFAKEKVELYRLVESAAHISNWVETSLAEDKAIVTRAKARGTSKK